MSSMFWIIFWLNFFMPLPVLTPLTQRKEEQCTVLKFFNNTGATPIQCWRQMQAVFGSETMPKNRVRVWFKRFQEEDQQTVKDKKHPGRKRTARSAKNIESVARALLDDCRKTVRMLAEEVGMAKSSVHSILKKDLTLSKIAPKLVPKLLTDEQQRFHRHLCEDNLKFFKENPEKLFTVITGNESWVSIREVESKQFSLEWIPKGSPALHPVKARCERSAKKLMLTIFFDLVGPVLVDFLPPQTNTWWYSTASRTGFVSRDQTCGRNLIPRNQSTTSLSIKTTPLPHLCKVSRLLP